jgi:hypothetical protein
MDALASSQNTNQQHVFITVSGGVAYIASAPKSVTVHIIDYDDLKADFNQTFAQFTPAEKAFYWSSQSSLGRDEARN